MSQKVVIVGGGQAGLQTAATLRNKGFDGTISLIAEESHLPYMRPPLSKGFLRGGCDEAALRFRQEDYFTSHRIDLHLGTKAVAIDRSNRAICLYGGERIVFDKLVLATGARVRMLPLDGAHLRNVAHFRTLDDARQIAQSLPSATNIAVIGGGFIGLEVAAAAAQVGRSVTIIEMADRLMARAVSPLISAHFLALHEEHGVDVRLNARLDALIHDGCEARGVRLADGREISAELVVVGIGVIPNSELAGAAGLTVADGIVVDEHLQTLDPDVFAIGDCARFPAHYAEAPIRLESVQNAVDQAKTVAANIMTTPTAFKAVPWFWTEQFSAKLQMAGLCGGYDNCLYRGETKTGTFSIEYYRAGRLIAVDSINDPAGHLAARKQLAIPPPI